MSTAEDRVSEPISQPRASLVDTSPPRRRLAAIGLWGVVLALAIVAAAAIAVGLRPRPQAELAEVAAAVARQPWIHAKVVRPSGPQFEAWFPPRGDVVASHSDGGSEFHDYHRATYYSYDPMEQVLYRLSEPQMRRSPPFNSLSLAMTLLAENEPALEKPLARLAFLGRRPEGLTVLSRHVARVTEQGRQRIDYRITATQPGLAEPMQLLFRVDAESKLPELFRMQGVWNGRLTSDETRFDYPASGPADVYALGVGRSATLVDRVPQGDLKRILAALEAGRAAMDDYRAIVVRHSQPMDYLWWCDLPRVIYRQGDKLRTDYVGSWTGDLLAVERPKEDADLSLWWRKQVQFFRMHPQYVMRGATLYSVDLKRQEGPGEFATEIAAVKKHHLDTVGGQPLPIDYADRPEFACRPPLGIGGQDGEGVLETNPQDGPPGCILLRVRHTRDQSLMGEQTARPIGEDRYWLDPKRDYIVMRRESLAASGSHEPPLYETVASEEVAQSPGGVWYATIVRRTPSHAGPGGETAHGDVVNFYVDFGVDLPDSLFDPPVPGKLP